MKAVADISILIEEFSNINPQGNCLILANELRKRLTLYPLPEKLIEKAHEINQIDFEFAERLLNLNGTKTDYPQQYDLVLLNFNKQICLATMIDDYLWFLGSDSKLASRPMNALSKFIVGSWELRNDKSLTNAF